jgi:uncharacterized protein (UPF0335 family)
MRGADMTTLKSAAVASLKSYLERIERLEEERAAQADDIRAVYAEAKADGFATKGIRGMVKRRRAKNPKQLDEDETILELYMQAVGMLPERPLALAVGALATDGLGRDQVVDAFKQLVPVGGEIIVKVGGDPLRIWRDVEGTARVELYVEPAAPLPEKTGRGLKPSSATVLSIVPADPIKAAADRAERRGKTKPPEDEPRATEDEKDPVE